MKVDHSALAIVLEMNDAAIHATVEALGYLEQGRVQYAVDTLRDFLALPDAPYLYTDE